MKITSTINTENLEIESKFKQELELLKQSDIWFLDIDKNSFLNLCKTMFDKVKHFEHMIVLGIGGSALWTASVLNALKKSNITVLDNIDPEDFLEKIKTFDLKNTCINVISKSGGTIETMLQLSILEDRLEQNNLSKSEHIICTTWKNSLLYKYSIQNNYKTLPVPETVWWRFSVLTPVWIFPLLFSWINVENLLKWAKNCINDTKSIIDFSLIQYQAYKNENRNITVFMSYNKKLMWLLDWYRQLLAESLWKNEEIWITPTLSFWSTDQHSQNQLYNEGPQDKLILFLSSKLQWDNKKYKVLWMDNEINIFDTQLALEQWSKLSLKKYNKPYLEIFLEEINEENIWQFFMLCMIQISLLAKLFWINAFDQPWVEEWKIQAKLIL